MTCIEKDVIDALENSTSISLNTLGGINHLLEQNDDFYRSKLLDEILKIVLNDIDKESQSELKDLTNFVNKCLYLNDDEIVVKELALSICSHTDLLKGCFKELISLLTNSNRTGFFRSQYLLSAFSLSLHSGAYKYAFIAYMLEEENYQEELFKDSYFKILGLSYSHFKQEDLFEKLEQLIKIDPNDELLYELGMAHMNKALNSEKQIDVRKNFKIAKDYFTKVDNTAYSNAKCYETLLDIFLGFFSSERESFNIEKLLELKSRIELSNMWHNYDDAFSWQSLRETELINWNKLVNTLNESKEHFSETSWFEPQVVIENYLLQLYKCNRTIFLKTESKGIDLLIEPFLTTNLIDNNTYYYLLEKWVKRNKENSLWVHANELFGQINDYKARYKLGNEIGVGEYENLSTPIIASLPNVELESEFDIFCKEYRQNQLGGTTLILKAQFECLSKSLIELGVLITKEVKFNFQWLLYNTLIFLESRMDFTQKNYDAVSYLFQKKPLPKEDRLQLDYSIFMKTIPSNGNTEIEVMDVAGGRADVLFNFTDHRFVVEVKREITQTQFEQIIKKYSLQGFEYQNTNIKTGILLVLDLDKANLNGVKSFEQQIKMHIIKDEEGYSRSLIIIKIPGRRNTPSKVGAVK